MKSNSDKTLKKWGMLHSIVNTLYMLSIVCVFASVVTFFHATHLHLITSILYLVFFVTAIYLHACHMTKVLIKYKKEKEHENVQQIQTELNRAKRGRK